MLIDNFYIDTINNINKKDIINSTILYQDEIIGKIKNIELVDEFICGNTWLVELEIISKNKKLVKQFFEEKERDGYHYKF